MAFQFKRTSPLRWLLPARHRNALLELCSTAAYLWGYHGAWDAERKMGRSERSDWNAMRTALDEVAALFGVDDNG